MSKQQTAVDWLVNQIITELDNTQDVKLGLYFMRFMELVKEAKQMEKEQIIDAWQKNPQGYNHTGEQYYNETYGHSS